MKLTEGAAILLVLILAALAVGAASYFFHAFGFPWIAWCALGYGAIVKVGGEMIVVRDPTDGPPAGPIEAFVNRTLVRLLLSTPAWFLASTVFLTLLIASAETFGLLPTSVSVTALIFQVKHSLRLENVRAE
jgi:hypothetical protein